MEILSLGEKIKKRRKELNMTLRDLAGDRITPGQISLVESGRSNPSMDLLEYLSDALKISVGYLVESQQSQADNICNLYIKMCYSFCMKKNPAKAKIYLSKLEDLANEYKLDNRQADILHLKAILYINEKEYYLAQETAITANELYVKQCNTDQIIRTFLLLGKISTDVKAYFSAMTYISQAEVEYKDSNMLDGNLITYIYFTKAMIAYRLEDDKTCNEYLQMVEESLDLIYDSNRYTDRLIEMADKCMINGEYEKAVKYTDKTVNHIEDSRAEEEIGFIEDMIGTLLCNHNKVDESIKHFIRAKDYRGKNRDSRLLDTIVKLCECLLKKKEITRCSILVEEILKDLDENDIENMTKINIIKYRIFMINDNDLEAEKCLLDTYKLLSTTSEYEELKSNVAMILAKYYVNKKSYEKAKDYINVGLSHIKKSNING